MVRNAERLVALIPDDLDPSLEIAHRLPVKPVGPVNRQQIIDNEVCCRSSFTPGIKLPAIRRQQVGAQIEAKEYVSGLDSDCFAGKSLRSREVQKIEPRETIAMRVCREDRNGVERRP